MLQDDLANSKTVVDNTLTGDATLGDDSLQAKPSPSRTLPEAGIAAGALRTTVLPRAVVREGAEHKLIADGKPRYEVAHRLGQGGVGDVLKAHDNDIERLVAIKRIRSDVKSHATVMRFAEEVRTVGNLEHPNIVPIHDVGIDQSGDYYFVMKYVHGETLEQIIEKLAKGDPEAHATYGFERRVEIMLGVLEAIAFAHAQGIIHRDIKPANIMVGPYGEVMVMDWGLARKIKGEELSHDVTLTPETQGKRRLFQTQVGTLLGTPAYMSPEQARGETLNEKSDIYSLCITFYEFLTLVHPLESKTTLEAMITGVITEPLPPAWTHRLPVQPSVPADLSWFVASGLDKDPAKRFDTVNAMIERMRARAEGMIPVQCPFTLSMRIAGAWRRGISRHPLRTMSLVGALFVWMVIATVLTIAQAFGGARGARRG